MGDGKTFDGIFAGFDQVPGTTSYNNPAYFDGLAKYCKDRLEEFLAGQFPAPVERNRQSNLLIAIIGMMLATRDTVHVVDFGGGLGQTFVTVAAAIGDSNNRIQYSVIDLPESINYIRKNNFYLKSGITGLNFLESIDELTRMRPVDVFYMGSSLQYIDDFGELLDRIFTISPEYLLINQTPMVLEAPTFVTAQVGIPGRVLAVRIFNIDHFVSEMRSRGYELTVRTCEPKVPGTDRFFNFPPEYRNDRSAILLFRRTVKRGRALAGAGANRLHWWQRVFGRQVS